MQQINLYLPEFRPSRDLLRAIHMLWGLLLFFILLCCVTVMGMQKNTVTQKKLDVEQESLVALQAQVQKVLAQKPTQSAEDLDQQIEKIQKVLQHRREVLVTISNQSLGNDKGFSAQLNTLAQASLNSVSLESFSLQYGGTYAEMTGKTRSADQVPFYLQRLQADPSFEKVGFGVIQVVPDKKDKSLLRFAVAKFVADEKNPREAIAILNDLNDSADKASETTQSAEAVTP